MNNEEKILAMLAQMQSDMTGMKADMAGMKADMVGMKTDMVGMKERLDQIDERSQRTAVLMETEVMDKLNLLYEGHGLIMETLAPKDRVDELEADVVVLKSAVKMLTQEVAELKKAQ